jgi:hypothetical protein
VTNKDNLKGIRQSLEQGLSEVRDYGQEKVRIKKRIGSNRTRVTPQVPWKWLSTYYQFGLGIKYSLGTQFSSLGHVYIVWDQVFGIKVLGSS